MKKNKVVVILKSLTDAEIRQFDKFVHSPVHNQHNGVIALFQYLRKHLNSEKALQREKVFLSLFPGERFDMQKVHYLSSYLLKVLEEYLAWKNWRTDEAQFIMNLIRAYSQHKLDGQFKKNLKKAFETHIDQPLRNAKFFSFQYQLQFEEYNLVRRSGRTKEYNLQKLSDSHDTAFLIEKLKNACLLLSHQAVTKSSYDLEFLNSVLAFLEDSELLKIPAIALYYHGYSALSDSGNEKSFNAMKNTLFAQKGIFELSEQRDLFILAINFCIRRLNSGDKVYLREAFEIYQDGLKKDVFFENGELSPYTYNNIVQSGINLKEFSVIEKFILDYKKYLPPNQRENCFSLNLSWLHYSRREYKKAMRLLLKMDLGKDVFTAFTVRTLMARMLFEQDEIDALMSHLQSFKVFIKRQKSLTYHSGPYSQFITFLQKIIANTVSSDEKRETLQNEINEVKVVAKEWLLEQVQK